MYVFCACATENLLPAEKLGAVIAACVAAKIPHVVVDDLCRVAAAEKNWLRDLRVANAELFAVACEPRAVKALGDFAGITFDKIYNLRIVTDATTDTADFFTLLGITPPVENTVKITLPPPPKSPAWYPVIDRARCVNCRQCADFCLFGVYAVVDNVVNVAQPQKCKPHCPACARLCPRTAIIFPKYELSPINGGLYEEDPQIRQDAAKLRHGGVAAKLRARNRGKLFKHE